MFAQNVDRHNNNIFDGLQSSSLQTPSGTPSSFLSTNGGGVLSTYANNGTQTQQSLSTQVKGWDSSNMGGAGGFNGNNGGISMQGVQDVAGMAKPLFSTLGGLASGGKTSTAGSVIKGLGQSDPTGAVSFLGDITNALFGSKMNNESISRFSGENVRNASLSVDASTNQSVTDAFGNFTYLEKIDQDDVGSDGWFSDKAKNKTKELNEQRRQANAHAMQALAQSVTDLDSNKDDSILTSYAALGGKLHRKDEEARRLFAYGGTQGSWWDTQGKQMVFGDSNNGGSSGWGLEDNGQSYLSAATGMLNTAAHWGDKDYNRQNLGSNAGLAGTSVSALNNALYQAHHKDDTPLAKRIGLMAYGGKTGGKGNVFASGGDYAQAAASALKLWNNAAIQAKKPDISSYTNALS